MMDKAIFVGVIVVAYFLGNISPAILIGKTKGIDIKSEGSGNAGTTNVLRVIGPKAAVITLIVDILKGFIAVELAVLVSTPLAAMCCALAAFLGHVWPVIFKFKGGKGVAVAFGAILGINWVLAVAALIVVLFGVLISLRVSVGSILGAVTFPILTFFIEPSFYWFGLTIAIIVLLKHRKNLVRVVMGEESRIHFKKGKAE